MSVLAARLLRWTRCFFKNMNEKLSETPQVVVVCAWYNRANYIQDTVDSLLAQDFEDFEIVIINDGSIDPKVQDKLDSNPDPRLRVVHQANTGFTLAIRRAIEMSNAPFIAIQGAGDVSFAARIKTQVEYLQNNPSCVGVGVRLEQIFVSNDGALGQIVVKGTENHRIQTEDFRHGSNPFTHGEVMFRRDIYESVGGYRPFFQFAQDRDLWLRMSERGHFAMLADVLYQRRSFEEDGVSTSVAKTVVQKKLSFFARQCSKDRELYGVDFVGLFGQQAGLFRYRNRELAKDLASMAFKRFRNGQLLDASILIHQSLSERLTFRGIALQALIYLSTRITPVNRVTKLDCSRIQLKSTAEEDICRRTY